MVVRIRDGREVVARISYYGGLTAPSATVDNALALGDALQVTTKGQSIVRLTVLKQILNKFRELLNKVRRWLPPEDSQFYRVRYTSVPSWKPWRDY